MNQLHETFRLPPDRLYQRMRPNDPYLNYCHWPYTPPVLGSGKLRPSALLYRAVEEMPHGEWVAGILSTIQQGLGDFRCVYGIKQIDRKWALEIYVYDYGRENRIVSVERLVSACRGQLKFPAVDPKIPYFMFSFDLTEAAAHQQGLLHAVNVYVGNPGSEVSSGIAYEFTAVERQLQNFYFFFDAQKHQREIIDKMTCSVWLQSGTTAIDELFRPELRDCHTICLANKRICDTIYFSGIRLDQLLFFLEWQQYPKPFTDFIKLHQHELDHLLYDVGVDYRTVGGRIEFLKHGLYGVF